MRFSKNLLGQHVVLVFVLVSMAAPAAWAGKPSVRVGYLTSVQGVVEVDGRPAEDGQGVGLGSVIRTRLGKATLLLGRESVFHLDQDTELKVREYVSGDSEQAAVDLAYGRTRALIRNVGRKKRMTIRSRSAVMGVRGTHVYVESPKDPSKPAMFLTVEGLAGVQFPSNPSRGQVVLRSHEATQIGRTGKPKVIQLGPERVQELVQAVAPPPAELKTVADLKRQQGERERRRFQERLHHDRMNHQLPMLDPLRDSPVAPVRVRVKGVTQ